MANDSGSEYDEDDDPVLPSRTSLRITTRNRSQPLAPRFNPRPSRRSVSRLMSGDTDALEMLDDESYATGGEGDDLEEGEDGEDGEEERDGEDFGEEFDPPEIGSDLDAINSGAATPSMVATAADAVKKGKLPQFLARKKETKTIKGQTYTILDDELMLEDDPRGEAKIDSDGNLLGGREYKVATFSSPHRSNPNKLYMLSIDAARAAGYRDSLYFFRRNPLMHKLNCTQPEKDRLITLGRISTNLKSRAVTMVSAKNCFKVMGATFVKDGKHVFDDYYEDKALAAGHKPGEPAFVEPYDPEKDSGTLASSKGAPPAGATTSGTHVPLAKPRPPPDKPSAPSAPRDDFLSLGTSIAFGGSGLQPFGRTWDPAAKKAKPAAHLNAVNWMEQYARSVGERNRELGVVRKMNLGQVQVGVGVKERDEDLWIEVEEEVGEDEEGEGEEMVLDITGGEETPIGLPPVPSTSSLSTLDSQQPPITLDSPSTSLPLPPFKKRKLIKVYNPIRGIYDPETNVPHVYKETQPTQAEVSQLDVLPELDVGEEGEKEREVKKRKLAKEGFATMTVVVDRERRDEGYSKALMLPGGWDFGAGPNHELLSV